MRRFFNILLLWLVMLALPLQGFAAAGMIDCGQTPHRAMPPVIANHDSVPESTQQHQDQHQDQLRHQHQGHHDLSAKCSVCANCCFGTIAVTSLDIVFTADAAGLTTTRFPEKPFSVNFPAGLERPPHLRFL